MAILSLFQIEVKYGEMTNSDCPKLGKLHASYKWLKESPNSLGGGSTGQQQPSRTPSKEDEKYTDPNYV